MFYIPLVLILITLILIVQGLYWRSSFHKAVQKYKRECGAIRPPINCQGLSKRIERSRKAALILLFFFPFPIALIQNLSWPNSNSLLLAKLSVASILAIGFFALKQLFKVPINWFFSDPLDWKKLFSAIFLGLGVASFLSLLYTVISMPALWTQMVDAILKKLGG